MIERADSELIALYVCLYFDEDVSVYIVNNLRRRGFDVLCARETGMLERDDEAQMAFAASHGRAIVTHNRHDFERLYRQYLAENKTHYGIIIAKRRARDSVVVAKLLDLLNNVMAEEMMNQLRYI